MPGSARSKKPWTARTPTSTTSAGDIDRLSLWRDLGERAVLVALPRPGNLAGMPHGSAELIAAATDAGECVYVPGIGAALVPTIEKLRPGRRPRHRVTWSVYNCEPVPTHALEALSLSEIEQEFRQELLEHTRVIEAWTPSRGWQPVSLHGRRVEQPPMGLPDGLHRGRPRSSRWLHWSALPPSLGLSDQAQSQVLTSTVASDAVSS